MRKVIYGLTGVMGSAVLYMLLAANTPVAEDKNEFQIPENVVSNSLSSVSGNVTTLFNHGTYQLTDVEYDSFEEKGVVAYEKANPMFYYIKKPPAPAPEPEESNRAEEPNSSENMGSSEYISLKEVLEKTYGDVEIKEIDLVGHKGYDVNTRKIINVDIFQAVKDFAEVGKLPLNPTHFERTSAFGVRKDPFTKEPAIHTGEDYSAPNINGANVYSVAPGIVSKVEKSNSGYGNHVIINHGSYSTLYSHLKGFGGFVEGDEVVAGSVIGKVGSTGRSTGPHLHFEFRIGDVALDPSLFFSTLKEEGLNK